MTFLKASNMPLFTFITENAYWDMIMKELKDIHKHRVDLATGVGTEEIISFPDILTLLRAFRDEVSAIRKQLYGGKNESEENQN